MHRPPAIQYVFSFSQWHLEQTCRIYAFTLVFFFFFVFVIDMLSAWNRKVCVNGSFTLFNFLWFCLYCMYFFKGFWGRPQKYRSACERGRTCIFTGYPPPLQLQSGFFCALVLLKHPIKHTVVGLWENTLLLSVWLQHPQVFTATERSASHSVHFSPH